MHINLWGSLVECTGLRKSNNYKCIKKLFFRGTEIRKGDVQHAEGDTVVTGFLLIWGHVDGMKSSLVWGGGTLRSTVDSGDG